MQNEWEVGSDMLGLLVSISFSVIISKYVLKRAWSEFLEWKLYLPNGTFFSCKIHQG